MLRISLAAEKIFDLAGIPITNSLFTGWIVIFLLLLITYLLRRRMTLYPSGFQVVVETIVVGLYNMFKSVMGEQIDRFYPLLITLFIYINFSNWMELLPGFGTIGFYKGTLHNQEFIPLFRSNSADLNTTFALALIAVISLQYYGIKSLGAKIYLKRFVNLKSPLTFFVGFLESISEIAKVVSFAFRLFGNIFAGEVLLAVAIFLTPVFIMIAPLPFYGLEVFVGFIQAFVFAMLTAVFLSLAIRDVGH